MIARWITGPLARTRRTLRASLRGAVLHLAPGIRARAEHIGIGSLGQLRDAVGRDDVASRFANRASERLRLLLGSADGYEEFAAESPAALFDLAPPTQRTQYASVGPSPWPSATKRRVSDARFVVARQDAELSLTDYLATLMSGRPIARAEGRPSRIVPIELPDQRELLALQADELERIAVQQLRHFCTSFGTTDRPNISVTLVSNRPEFVWNAAERIAAQRGVDVELLIGLHGVDAASGPDHAELVTGAVRSVTVVEFTANEVFGATLDDLASRATADFVSKWDDDDLYGDHHLLDLWLGAVLLRSPLVGKAAEFVSVGAANTLVRRAGGRCYVPSRFLAGGALLVDRRALADVGGWGHLPRSVDQELISRFRRRGLMTSRIHGFEFVLVRHGAGHTWSAPDNYFLHGAKGWPADAIWRAGIGSPPQSRPMRSEPPRHLHSAVCVPVRSSPSAVALWELRAREWPAHRQLVIADDHSDPPIDGARQLGTVVPVPFTHAGFGAGRARTAAAEHTDADLLFFIDADIHIEPAALAEIERWFAEGFRGAVHSPIDFVDVTPQELFDAAIEDGMARAARSIIRRSRPGQTWRHPYWARSADYAWPDSNTYRATVGGFIAIDRWSYQRVGDWADIPDRGVEDTEFGYRLLAAGIEQRLYRDGGVVHLGESTHAQRNSADGSDARERWLRRLIPIWNSGDPEYPWLEPGGPSTTRPFAAHPDRLQESADGALQEPFCLASPSSPTRGELRRVAEAFVRFGTGEVLVTDESSVDQRRYVAVWALRHVRRRLGGSVAEACLSDAFAHPEIGAEIRRIYGTAFIPGPVG